ncbi:MAG: class I SAM-dependent RNA methyltransferase [Cyclobacteriaceae bacterium]|nr:class I SAM-dependent RNA methyltransferase [Cyclobacteriaceae bacterium]
MAPTNTITVTCNPEVNQILALEIKELGYQLIQVNPKSVELKGTLKDCMHLNLHLRTANRVLLLIKRFKAGHPDQLYQAVSRIPWEDHIPHDGYLSVTSFIRNKHILDTRFGNQKTKDAIVDRLFRLRKQRPDSGPKRDRTVIYLHWVGQDCHLYFDTSGETISKHGYRRIPFKAPMREALAAAVIKATKWQPGMPLVNPMSGSGTLVIEAALMAKNFAPGLLRKNFGFMHLRTFQQQQWDELCNQARGMVQDQVEPLFHLSDHSLEALRSARSNAKWAGVDKLIRFHHLDFAKTEVPPPPGVVILNPEYGSRLGDVKELEGTYKQIGDFFKEKCAGYWGYIFSGNPELSKKIGLRTSRKIPFFNGQLECRLLEFELYAGSKKSG